MIKEERGIQCRQEIVDSGIATEMIRQLNLYKGTLEVPYSLNLDEYDFRIEVDEDELDISYIVVIKFSNGSEMDFGVDLKTGDFGVAGERLNPWQLALVKKLVGLQDEN